MLRHQSNHHQWAHRVVFAVFCLLFITCSASRPRLILLIIVDTMRADHIGCYGYESIHTPNIDRLAAEGVLYENTITAVPVTLPSISTIFTGAYPLQHGLRDNGPFQLGDRWTTIAECLRDAGYSTGAFVSAAVLSHEHNLAQGYDIYDDDVSAPYEPYHPWMITMKEQFQGIECRAETTIDRALGWLADQSHRDVFLTVHLFDPHLPYDPPPPFRDSYDRFYDGEIAYVDQEIGRLLEEVRKHRNASDIVTILVADHGEGLMDHDEAHHGDLLFEETLRVPLILHGSDAAPGTRVKNLVRTVDIVPTICALTGTAVPQWSVGQPLPGAGLTNGRDQNPQEDPFRHTAYIETFRPRLSHNWCELRGVRTERWKLIEGPGYELYDLKADPKEMDNVAHTHETLVDSLVQLMDKVAFTSVRKGSHFAASLELSQQQKDKLQSLGYITPKDARHASNDSLAVWYFPPQERGPALNLPHPRVRIAASLQRNAAKSHYRLAFAALKKNKLAEAESNFLAAIRYNRNFTQAYIGLAEVARCRGDEQQMQEYLHQAQNIHSEDPAAARMLADAFLKLGRVTEASQVVDKAISQGVSDETLIEMSETLHELTDDAGSGMED